MKILLLEDEEGIRSFIRINLKRHGYEVIEAVTGEEALLIAQQEPDLSLALLDIMLPGELNGVDVCRRLRSQYEEIGIVMLTAKGEDQDKVLGFDSGADDYIVKPFSPVELIARIKALSRRINRSPKSDEPSTLSISPFILHLDSRKLYKGNLEIDLTPKEFALVQMLMKRVNTAVSRDEILNEVWGRNYIGDLKTVDIHIRRIRKKIEEDASHPIYIETIWGYGYMWRMKSK